MEIKEPLSKLKERLVYFLVMYQVFEYGEEPMDDDRELVLV